MTFAEPKAALEKKGFSVTVIDASHLPNAATLEGILQNANQCWVISDNNRVLNSEHTAVLEKQWKDGMGMYILGDNDPFYYDANVLLSSFGLPLLSGNQPGAKVLKESTSDKGPGFIRHPITTGLESLYEGVTISFLPESVITSNGMVDIMREDQSSKIVVAYLEARGGKGALVVDGGFTKLYPKNWATTTGTARFVVNIAAMLAVK